MRLRRSDCSGPGIARRRRGRGWSYRYSNGEPVRDPLVLDRIRQLAVPPAWVDVWICPWPNGHIQAIGTDAAGRRQYRYHDDWHRQRNREKFERVLTFAERLPDLRATVADDLAAGGLGREQVLATITRLLDVGYFRIGGQEYAAEHETFGVASLRKEHVTLRAGVMAFDYQAKGSIERCITIQDPEACEIVSALRRRRSGGPNLFVYREGRQWHDVHADHVNGYIKAAAGEQYSSKDFRTWSATVLAAVTLAGMPDLTTSKTASRRAVTKAIKFVAAQLGNTPAVCRSSYVDPRVVDRFLAGDTITARVAALPPRGAIPDADRRRAVEEAVADLIGNVHPAAPGRAAA